MFVLGILIFNFYKNIGSLTLKMFLHKKNIERQLKGDRFFNFFLSIQK